MRLFRDNISETINTLVTIHGYPRSMNIPASSFNRSSYLRPSPKPAAEPVSRSLAERFSEPITQGDWTFSFAGRLGALSTPVALTSAVVTGLFTGDPGLATRVGLGVVAAGTLGGAGIGFATYEVLKDIQIAS